jgi:chromosome segregation ATPase
MLSGRQALGSLDQGMRELHDSVTEIDRQVKQGSGELMDLQRQQSERFKRMAHIRLDHVISGELSEGLDVADQRARELVRQRGSKLGAVNRQIKSTRGHLAELDEQRAAAGLDCDRATGALDSAEAKTQQRLEEDAQYQAQLEKTRQAERTADHAMEKTRQAQETRKEKGQPYEDDPLFSYLWRRRYGTAEYSAGSLARYLDDWVAGLCDYHSARPNYSTLLEIPVRLEEHAKHLRDKADEEFIQLTRMEVEAAAQDGVPTLKEAVDRAQATLDGIDEEIEATEDKLKALEQARGRFADGEDEDFQQAVKTISSAFERESLLSLYEYARATATPEDDLLVREMEEARERLGQVSENIADRKKMRQRQSDRLHELEDIRRRFKRNRFDSAHSEFRNDSLLTLAVSQFLAGAVTGRELWRTIERGQRYRKIRANPDFGSGGFTPRAGTWHTPFPRHGGGWCGGFNRRRPRRGGGGFRTGGGF